MFGGVNQRDSHGFTFTPLVLFVGLWVIFSILLIRFTPLPLWASILLGLLAEVLFLQLCNMVFDR